MPQPHTERREVCKVGTIWYTVGADQIVYDIKWSTGVEWINNSRHGWSILELKLFSGLPCLIVSNVVCSFIVYLGIQKPEVKKGFVTL